MAGKNGRQTQTGGRDATTGHIPGEYALAVGMPKTPGPPGWKWTKLSDVARLETGHTPSRNRPDYWGGDIPWIGIRDATANHGSTLIDTNQHTNQLGIDNSSARVLPENTVCLSRTASVGYVVVMGRPMATSQDFVNWVCSDDLDYRFLKYVLLSENRSFLRFASGTTHQTIYFPEVKAFHICLPPLSEQKAIAAILDGLDAKIELNRRMNETLESLARALFKSWFVDFDPVRAKMDGREPPGLSPATAALFPDSFEHHNGDLVPCGWQVAPFSSLFALPLRNGVSRPKRVRGTGTHMVNMGELFAHRRLGEVPMARVPLNEDEKERLLIEAGDILFARQSLVLEGAGQCSFVTPAKEPRTFESHLIRCRIDTTKADPLVWFYYFMSSAGRDQIASIVNHTAAAGIRGSDLSRLPVLIPPQNLQTFYGNAVRGLETRISSNESENRTLTALRDTLLPKLLSGEVRVVDAERSVERVD